MWAKKDNGSDVGWLEASDYCRSLQLGGYSDWRLPTIEELEGISAPHENVPGQWGNGIPISMHVKGNLKLSGWHWSQSDGDAYGERSYFGFVLGHRGSDPVGKSQFNRALCVRRSVQ
jgi:hypothetical protein